MKRTRFEILGLLIALSVIVQTTTAQFLPTDARALNSSRVPFLFKTNNPKTVPLVEQVGAIGMTVSDVDASIDFTGPYVSGNNVSLEKFYFEPFFEALTGKGDGKAKAKSGRKKAAAKS